MGLRHCGIFLCTACGSRSFRVGVLMTAATRQAGARTSWYGCLPQVHVVVRRVTSEGGCSVVLRRARCGDSEVRQSNNGHLLTPETLYGRRAREASIAYCLLVVSFRVQCLENDYCLFFAVPSPVWREYSLIATPLGVA